MTAHPFFYCILEITFYPLIENHFKQWILRINYLLVEMSEVRVIRSLFLTRPNTVEL
jgi:hypothetical protein